MDKNINNYYLAKYKVFNNGKIKYREYDRFLKVPKDKNSIKQDNQEHEKRVLKSEGKISKRSLSRTRLNLKELIENNEDRFLSFITLTYKDEVENIDEAYKDLRTYIRQCKWLLNKTNEELFYIAVPEIQHHRAMKSGKYVIHFHLLTSIPIGSKLIPERELKRIQGENYKGFKIIKYYDLKYWDKGYSTAQAIEDIKDNGLSNYLIKYLYKDLDNRFYGRQKLLHSNNLKVPEFNYLLNPDKMKKEYHNNIISKYIYLETDFPFIEYVYKKDKV